MATPRVGNSKNAAAARERILASAVKRFSEVGYRAARMSDIAKAAGYSEATAFHHFGTKAELFRAVVAHLDAGTSWFQPDDPPDALPEALYQGELAYHQGERWEALDRAWADAQAGEEDLLRMIRPVLSGAFEELEGVLRRAGDGGDAKLLARWLIAVSYGSRVLRRYDPTALSPEETGELLKMTAELALARVRSEGAGGA